MSPVPKCFMSYSHDNEEHEEWVLSLATRLRENGVDVILDQWDLRLGGDIPAFMDRLTESDRVICVCSEAYASKANEGKNGVGYEKMILTSELIKNINSEKIIPIVRCNKLKAIPTFLITKRYVDFCADFESAYLELISGIHDETTKARPTVGKNPFEASESPIAICNAISSSQYSNPNSTGTVEFDYENNNGCFVVGSGSMQFDLQFSSASDASIHMYSDPENIEGIALADGVRSFSNITNASNAFDYTSRVRTPHSDEFVIVVNKNGFFLAIKLGVIKMKGRNGAKRSSVSFEYKITQNKKGDFE